MVTVLIMPPKAMSEARMREIIRDQVTTSMNEFMENMNRGAGGAGAGGDGAGGAGAWEKDKVKFATATLQGRALTWWNGRTASMGIDAANGTPWAEVHEGEKRKGEGDRGGRGDNRRDYNRRQNQRRANAGAMTNAVPNDNEVHKTAACRCPDKKDVTCSNCNEKGHLKRDCPTLKKNGQGENNRGAVYKLGAVDAQQDPKVVTGTFLLNNQYATALF
ncbi:putative reverse transcriptase domain-containing protein [Tanacetum coccineum]